MPTWDSVWAVRPSGAPEPCRLQDGVDAGLSQGPNAPLLSSYMLNTS